MVIEKNNLKPERMNATKKIQWKKEIAKEKRGKIQSESIEKIEKR